MGSEMCIRDSVLAIIARIIDASGSKRGTLKKRLLRNKTALGHNYREVLSHLEERKPRSAPRAKGKQPAKPAASPAKGFKSAEHIDDEDEHDHPEPIEEDDEEDLRARGLVEDVEHEDGDEDEELTPAPEADEDEVMGD